MVSSAFTGIIPAVSTTPRTVPKRCMGLGTESIVLGDEVVHIWGGIGIGIPECTVV